MTQPAYERWIFSGRGDEPRLRRPSDAFLLVVSALAVIFMVLLADAEHAEDRRYAGDLGDLFRSAAWIFETAYDAAIVFAVAIPVAAFVTRRWRLLRDIAFAVGCTLLVGGIAEAIVDVSPPFPAMQIAAVLAVLVVARPDLALPMRHITSAALWLALPAAIVLERAVLSAVLGGAALGLLAGMGTRLAFGTSAGLVERNRMRELLLEFGFDFDELEPDPRQQAGSARYLGRCDGRQFAVRLYGRDALDTRFAARLWRWMWYRDAGPRLASSRAQLVEHEALMLLLAERGGTPTPELVCSGVASSGDAVLVTTIPSGVYLDEANPTSVSEHLLTAIWGALGTLRTSGLTHGQLDARALVVDSDAVTIVDFASTRSNADDVARTTDVAELLVSTAIVVGNERAVDAAFTALGSDALVDALPYVQRAALNPWLRAQARAAKFDLDELRSQAAQRAGVELPAIQPLRRLNLRDIAFMVLIGVAAYILITGLLDIGIDNIVDALSEADLAWVLLALFISQFTYFGNAFAMQGAVGQPIPFGPVVVLQAAIKFINLTVPTMAGRIALNTRFLQKLGVPLAVALTQGGIDGIAGTIVQVVLFLSVLPFIDVTLDTTDQDGNILAIIGIIAVGALIGAIAFLVIPVLRRKILPYLKAAWDNAADVMHQPSRIGHLLAGNVAVELLYALTLGACCRAYGIDISLTELLFINIAVTVFAGIIPVPGGIGVAEAGLTAGLMLFGVPEAIAFAAALTHRLVTYYVPPAWGWIALRWLGKHGYV